VNPFRGLTSSRGLNRALPWIAGAVLLVGVLAFWQTTIKTDENRETFSNEPVQNASTVESVPLPPEARQVVVQFIKTAVMRQNLAEAWTISGPQIRQDLSRQQWLTGNIPVVPYPNAAGVLATGGGLIVTALLDGTIVALDDETLEQLWSINVGTGVNAHPITYAVDGKQYIAIATGLTRNQIGRIANSPELKTMAKNATMLFVFGL